MVDRDGLRKHTEAFVFIPRKNGKSTFAAIIAQYMLVADYEPRAQVYIGAGSLKQAPYCFDPCREMASKAPSFATHWGVTIRKKRIELRDSSFLEPTIGDPPDGSNPHLAILDEAHENENFAQHVGSLIAGIALLLAGVMVSQSDKTGTVLTTVQSSLAAIQEGQKATCEDIGKLSAKLDSTADGLADTKAEVAGIKTGQQTHENELARMREYEDTYRR